MPSVLQFTKYCSSVSMCTQNDLLQIWFQISSRSWFYFCKFWKYETIYSEKLKCEYTFLDLANKINSIMFSTILQIAPIFTEIKVKVIKKINLKKFFFQTKIEVCAFVKKISLTFGIYFIKYKKQSISNPQLFLTKLLISSKTNFKISFYTYTLDLGSENRKAWGCDFGQEKNKLIIQDHFPILQSLYTITTHI